MKAVGGTLQKKGGTAIRALVSIRSKFNALDALLVGECGAPGVAEALRALALDYGEGCKPEATTDAAAFQINS
jgi:hypothetical protein